MLFSSVSLGLCNIVLFIPFFWDSIHSTRRRSLIIVVWYTIGAEHYIDVLQLIKMIFIQHDSFKQIEMILTNLRRIQSLTKVSFSVFKIALKIATFNSQILHSTQQTHISLQKDTPRRISLSHNTGGTHQNQTV